MPQEFRTILFSRPEVLEALAVLARATRPDWPAGQLLGVTVSGEAELHVHVEVLTDDGGVRTKFEVDQATVAAALIMHCRAQRIPLARTAKKSLQRLGDGLALRMTTRTPEHTLPKTP